MLTSGQIMILKLITFDVTGTLLQLREGVGSQYSKIASNYNVTAAPDMLTKNFPLIFKILQNEHPNFGANNGIGWQEWWRLLVFRVFQNSLPGNALVEPLTFQKISSDLIDIYSTKECWRLTDGAQDLLDKLRNRNIRLGVISNYDPRLKSILTDLNIHHYFSFIIDSFSVSCEKPDSAIFKFVENMDKSIEKNEILHVGDNPRLDFLGARNVGWNALLIAKNPTVLEKFPSIDKEWVVASINEVYQVLESKKLI